MIAFVAGRVAEVGLTSVVLEVGGVGLELNCTPGTLATLRPGRHTTLPTSMVVREDSLTLFGFLDDEEKHVFELLQTASGVGPKLAQAMLAVLSPDDLRRAVATEDVKALTTVPGVGQKGAQRIILELRDRLGPPGVPSGGGRAPTGAAGTTTPDAEAWRSQVHEALTGLGWSAKEAERAVDRVAPEADADRGRGREPEVAALLRAALRSMSKA